jgi:SOS-response transcriptional repressor LexA
MEKIGGNSIHPLGKHAFIKDCFTFRVSDNSMQDDGILDGDLILAISGQPAQNGDMVIIKIENGQPHLRRYCQEGNSIRLESLKAEGAPLKYREHQHCIVGIVIGILRKY